METFKKHLKPLLYLIKHKYFVYKVGREIGVPIWQLIIHDVSKLFPSEWVPFVNRFHKRCETDQEQEIYDTSKNKHHNRNPHHWEHWVYITSQQSDGTHVKIIEMEKKYALELVADWCGANRAVSGKWGVLTWYKNNKEKILMHDITRAFVEETLASIPYLEKKTDEREETS